MTTTRVPAANIAGLHGFSIKFIARKMMGRVPDSLGVLWHHRPVMWDLMRMGRKTERWHELDRDLATYAVMAAASVIGCNACLDYNYFIAHNKGLDEAKVRQVLRWRTSDAFSPLERRVMEYAEAASLSPPAVAEKLSDALLVELGPAALVELAARVAFMNMSARMNLALGIPSEEFASACGLPPLNSKFADDSSAESLKTMTK